MSSIRFFISLAIASYLFELKLRMGIITQLKTASVVQTESRRIDSYAEVQPTLADLQLAKIIRISQVIYDY